MKAKIISLRRPSGKPAEMTDEALLAACAVGDTSALGALFDRFNNDVYRFLTRRLPNQTADVDDLVQTTFLTAFRSAHGFRRGAKVRTWLLGVSVNVLRHHLRAQGRRENLVSAVSAAPAMAHSLPADDLADRNKLMARVSLALRALPEDLHVVFVLCDLEQIAGTEVATALGVPPGTVWRRLHDARRRLREYLAKGQP